MHEKYSTLFKKQPFSRRRTRLMTNRSYASARNPAPARRTRAVREVINLLYLEGVCDVPSVDPLRLKFEERPIIGMNKGERKLEYTVYNVQAENCTLESTVYLRTPSKGLKSTYRFHFSQRRVIWGFEEDNLSPKPLESDWRRSI